MRAQLIKHTQCLQCSEHNLSQSMIKKQGLSISRSTTPRSFELKRKLQSNRVTFWKSVSNWFDAYIPMKLSDITFIGNVCHVFQKKYLFAIYISLRY